MSVKVRLALATTAFVVTEMSLGPQVPQDDILYLDPLGSLQTPDTVKVSKDTVDVDLARSTRFQVHSTDAQEHFFLDDIPLIIGQNT